MKTIVSLALATAALLSMPALAQQLPRPVTSLTIKLPNGRTVDPSTYKGKVVTLALVKFT